MESTYTRALLTVPPVILGRALQPFSCWHALVLTHFDNPLMTGTTGDEGITTGDVIFFLWVCGLTHGEGLAALASDDAITEARAWGGEVEDWDIDEVCSEVHEYLTDYLDFPKFWEKDGEKGKASGIPWFWKLIGTVVANVNGISATEAWDMPINQLAIYRASVAEDNGSDLLSEREAALIAQANAG